MRRPEFPIALLVLLAAAGASAFDLDRVETHTIVVYTTPALRDVLEGMVLPRFMAETGLRVEPVYITAASEYYRLRLSRDRPEADLFLHASPMFIEKGHAEGYFLPLAEPPAGIAEDHLGSRRDGGGRPWAAFAWSPLVTVHAAGAQAPDLADPGLRFGLPHPRLSNNGVYAALFFEELDPEAGRGAVAQTVVQPTNARATIGGVADGSFDVTLGYEAVGAFYKGRGAQVAYDVPSLHGQRATTPVLFCAGLVRNHPHEGAERFIAFLFSDAVQGNLSAFDLRAVVPGHPDAPDAVPLGGVRMLHYDWGDWADLERALPSYEVTR